MKAIRLDSVTTYYHDQILPLDVAPPQVRRWQVNNTRGTILTYVELVVPCNSHREQRRLLNCAICTQLYLVYPGNVVCVKCIFLWTVSERSVPVKPWLTKLNGV